MFGGEIRVYADEARCGEQERGRALGATRHALAPAVEFHRLA